MKYGRLKKTGWISLLTTGAAILAFAALIIGFVGA